MVETAPRLHSRRSRTTATGPGRIADPIRQRIRSLASEIWQVLRWLLLTSLDVTIYLLRGRTEQSERSIIRFGNSIFRQGFPNELFADFASTPSLPK